MNFDWLLTRGMSLALPVVAVVLVCAAGYLLTKRRRELSDSPWFWVFAFSAMGSLGLWAISGKYDDRQKRVEARYEARQRIAEQAAQGAGAAAPHVGEGLRDSRRLGETPLRASDGAPLQRGYSSDRRVPLRFLAAALLGICLFSAAMLWRQSRIAVAKETNYFGTSKRDAERNRTGANRENGLSSVASDFSADSIQIGSGQDQP